VYIDEKAGSDTTGTGAELAPYATALAAYQSLKPQPSSDATPTSVANLLVRKADSVERNEWVELSASAKKKLVRLIEQWRKKEAKALADGERLEKAKKEAEERDRLKREEAKSVVLVDDSSKGEAKRVNLPCELRSSGWGWG
jgi:asparaginyl-tRNA synthetase